jgi:hypothetical protein
VSVVSKISIKKKRNKTKSLYLKFETRTHAASRVPFVLHRPVAIRQWWSRVDTSLGVGGERR